MPSQATQFEGLLDVVPDVLTGMDRSGQMRSTNEPWCPLTMRQRAERNRFFQRWTVGRELNLVDLREKTEYLTKHGPAGGGAR